MCTFCKTDKSGGLFVPRPERQQYEQCPQPLGEKGLVDSRARERDSSPGALLVRAAGVLA